MDDITRILDCWPYVSEDVTVRIVEGMDNRPKVQMRLDLGLLQMEYDGRPDGKRPHGFESLLEYFQDALSTHIAETGGEEGFTLKADECAALRSEALQYYYRYLSLFHLKHYDAVERDTARNLRVFHFIRIYAEDEDDRFSLEQYRPYVVMMNTRAKAYMLMEQQQFADALESVDIGIDKIEKFFKEFGRPKLADKSSEMVILKKLKKEIQEKRRDDPLEHLRAKMKEAVEREDYESAAQLRDQIRKVSENTLPRT